jgi:sensor histidine kinase YesM
MLFNLFTFWQVHMFEFTQFKYVHDATTLYTKNFSELFSQSKNTVSFSKCFNNFFYLAPNYFLNTNSYASLITLGFGHLLQSFLEEEKKCSDLFLEFCNHLTQQQKRGNSISPAHSQCMFCASALTEALSWFEFLCAESFCS